jgi:hypothetical protein
MIRAARLLAAGALAAACSTSAAESDARAVDASRAAQPRDARRLQRGAQIDAALRAALVQTRETTGLWLDPERRPLVEFDEAAPAAGDVALRYVEGVRRAVIRLPEKGVSSGDFDAATDVAPLVARGTLFAAARERDVPPWVLEGVALVAAQAVDRQLHARVLESAPTPDVERLFGRPDADPLAAAMRVRALVRAARVARPIPKLLEEILAGKSEDAAVAAVGIERREFLDAAEGTEQAKAAHAILDDPLFAPLSAARTALGADQVAAADTALAGVTTHLDDPAADPWLAADARLVLARIAVLRGETRAARAVLDLAKSSGRVVRRREARMLEACVALLTGDAASAVRLLGPQDAASADPALRKASSTAVDAVAAATADEDPGIRRVALELLVLGDARRGRGRASELTADPDPELRARAAELAR